MWSVTRNATRSLYLEWRVLASGKRDNFLPLVDKLNKIEGTLYVFTCAVQHFSPRKNNHCYSLSDRYFRRCPNSLWKKLAKRFHFFFFASREQKEYRQELFLLSLFTTSHPPEKKLKMVTFVDGNSSSAGGNDGCGGAHLFHHLQSSATTTNMTSHTKTGTAPGCNNKSGEKTTFRRKWILEKWLIWITLFATSILLDSKFSLSPPLS